uniref:Variant surface glycoprotein 429 n=1 Tax=Trypanosoma brucei TaxID=5691 RepID=M4SX15_9TRYP|nr:variant surface glycoprotein 429 [Trypanosoma brucei]
MRQNILWTVITLAVATLAKNVKGTVKEGQNGGDFIALCGLIEFARDDTPEVQAATTIQTIAEELMAVNLSLAPEPIQALAKAKKEEAWGALQSPFKEQAAPYEKHWTAWTKSVQEDAPQNLKDKIKQFSVLKSNSDAIRQLAFIADSALAIERKAAQAVAGADKATIDGHLDKALYGSGGKEATLTFSGKTRKQLCGNDAATAGEQAGKALLTDLLCVCAGQTSESTGGKTCCNGCEASPNNDDWVVTSAGKTRALAIANKCPPGLKTQAKSTAVLNARLATFYKAVNSTKGTGEAVKHVLDQPTGTGAGGCTGQDDSASNTGRCVKYSDDSIIKNTPEIEWQVNLRKAAAAYDKRRTAEIKLAALEAEISLLNATATALLWAPKAFAAQTNGSNLQQTTTPSDKAKECETIEKDADCDSKDFCTYDSKEKSDKKCKYNATKATKTGVSLPQTQTGVGTETTTKKCKGRPEKECKFPDCKWEGKECKDSSILVNKQFALSVVSAAFAALLF